MQETSRRRDRNLIKGATGDWEVVIGLEVHAQVASKAKLFSGASTAFGGAPNSHVSLVDAAMPGMLPVINEACIDQAVRTGLGLKAQINLVSVFDRKNYFYPDLPQGYQISQYKQPDRRRGRGGGRSPTARRVRGRHRAAAPGAGRRQVDPRPAPRVLLRRSQPLGRGADGDRLQARHALGQAGAGLRLEAAHHPALSRHLRRRHGEGQPARRRQRLGAPAGRGRSARAARSRTSTRSASSARPSSTRRAARSTSSRTAAAIEQETRLFDSAKGETRSMRSKEEAHDYRYFPDPDLLPLELTQDYVDGLKAGLPELPDAKKARFMSDYGLSAYDADVLVAERESAEFFEAVAKGRDGKTAANWVINELFGRLNKEGLEVSASPVSAAQLGRHHRPDRVQRHLRQDRQGRVRDRLERGRRPGRDRREARPRAGHRHRRHRDGRRRGDRRQPRQGRRRARPSPPCSAGSSARS